nr:MAG TPA: hypothetical protein [Ackermannviridae sp.]
MGCLDGPKSWSFGCLLEIQSAHQIQRQQGSESGGDVERAERSQQQNQICGDRQFDNLSFGAYNKCRIHLQCPFFAARCLVAPGGIFFCHRDAPRRMVTAVSSASASCSRSDLGLTGVDLRTAAAGK